MIKYFHQNQLSCADTHYYSSAGMATTLRHSIHGAWWPCWHKISSTASI